MFGSLPLIMLLAAQEPTAPATPPRYRDGAQTAAQDSRGEASDGTATDPLFNRDIAATDDAAFILAAVENSRQGVIDARAAAQDLAGAELRATAQKIGAQNQQTTQRLEKLATTKGWRLPQPNPGRQSSLPFIADGNLSAARASANFIVNQISVHQNTLAQYQAQIAGKGDADLKRALRDMLPGYRANLEKLLTLKP